MLLCAPLATLLWYLLHEPISPALLPANDTSSYTPLQCLIRRECGSPLRLYNDLTPLHNASQTFTSLLRDLHRARREILVEYYILGCDRVGGVVLDLLMRRSRAGVRVCVLYDGLGSYALTSRQLSRLRASGIEARAYAPLRFPYLSRTLNRRNHRKIVVIDGSVAYVGGVNIASRYIDGGRQGFWRDEHLRIRGESALDLRSIFLSDWIKAGGEALPELITLHKVAPIALVQILSSESGATRYAHLHTLIKAFGLAKHNIRISTPYFLPPAVLLEVIITAVSSGVEVELLLPERSDFRIVALAAEDFVRHLARQGVKIYRYRNGFLHAKTITIDDNITIIGSANLDYRSLYHNMETSAVIYNRTITATYISRFRADVALSARFDVTLSPQPTHYERLLQGFARLLAPLM